MRERSNERRIAGGDDIIDTSSFAEDISFHQTKTEEASIIRIDKLTKLPKSLAEDKSKLSETGMKELSIVESDNQASGQGTPAPVFGKKDKFGFKD